MPAKTLSKGTLEGTRKHPCKYTQRFWMPRKFLSTFEVLIFAFHVGVLCQQRKVKCDRNEPCANCVKARIDCISPSTLPPKKRKKRFPEAELLARLRRYEDHLRVGQFTLFLRWSLRISHANMVSLLSTLSKIVSVLYLNKHVLRHIYWQISCVGLWRWYWCHQCWRDRASASSCQVTWGRRGSRSSSVCRPTYAIFSHQTSTKAYHSVSSDAKA